MSEDLAAKFAASGYVILEELFSEDEVRELKAETARVLAEVRQNKGEKALRSGVYVGMSAASAKFREAAAKPALVAALKAIIGEKVTFLSDKVVFKNGAVEFGTPWHQDYPYWEGSHKFSVWIALDDALPENGCLKFWPGSHLQGYRHHAAADVGDTGFASRLEESEIDNSQIVDMPARRGTAIIFHDLLFHASYPNLTGKDRMALISTYKDGTLADPDYAWAVAAFEV